jgi:hypothetical protein
VHDNHGGDDEDANDATDQGSTSQGYKDPSSDDDEGDESTYTTSAAVEKKLKRASTFHQISTTSICVDA